MSGNGIAALIFSWPRPESFTEMTAPKQMDPAAASISSRKKKSRGERERERGGVEEIVGGEETISDAPWV